MNENEQYIFDTLRGWIWSGFYTPADIDDMLLDIIEPEADPARLKKLAKKEFASKLLAEHSWPQATDFDQLAAAFDELWSANIIALHNAGYTISDGHSDVADVATELGKPAVGYCFYHAQDVETAVDGFGLMLAFGALDNDRNQSIEIGKQIVTVLKAHGFQTEWAGDPDTRINIPTLNWQKRHIN